MKLQETIIYNVIRNNEVISLSELKNYFNVSIKQGASISDSRELMNDLNSLIEKGDVIKFNDSESVLYKISPDSLKNDLEC